MKRGIILQHAPSTGVQGQLANQLWNYISVYAYCLERGIECRNYSFFEYQHFFDIPTGNVLISTLYFAPYGLLKTFVPEHILVPVWRKWYKLFVFGYEHLLGTRVVFSGNAPSEKGPYYLPPSTTNRDFEIREKNAADSLFFDGWLFRNPTGIEKYRTWISERFAPTETIRTTVEEYIKPLRQKYDHLVGVHIRQGDYKTFKGGRYYVDPLRARTIMEEYLVEHNLDSAKTLFIIASNGTIPVEITRGLNVLVSTYNAAEDLFILASCNTILGSDSSFGAWAAYYGNIPHIIFQNEALDWEYYRGKTTYFQNKYCTLVHF